MFVGGGDAVCVCIRHNAQEVWVNCWGLSGGVLAGVSRERNFSLDSFSSCSFSDVVLILTFSLSLALM